MDLIILSIALALFIEMEIYYFLANFWSVEI